MGSLRKALMFQQICLLALFSTLYLNVDAHKHKTTEQEVLEASKKFINQNLQLVQPSVESTTPKTTKPADSFYESIKDLMKELIKDIDERVTYANQRVAYASKMDANWTSDDSYKVATSTKPVHSTDKHATAVSSNVPDQTSDGDSYTESTTKPFKTGEQFVEDLKAFLIALILDVDHRVAKKFNAPNITTTLPKKVNERSLNDSYSKMVSSATPVYSTEKHTPDASSYESKQTSTADAYTESTLKTTTAYSTDSHSVDSSQHEKPSQDVLSTTPIPPVSAVPRPPSLVGSISGVPGINFPDYTDIPITSFTCADKTYLPGFYADLETGCQVFHVCWQNRRESFLCPLGTTFNQALLACDYWYSTNCSLAPHYYDVNEEGFQSMSTIDASKKSMVDLLLEKSKLSVDASPKSNLKPDEVLSIISKFLPVKAKVVIYPEADGKRAKIVASTSVGKKEVVYKEEEEQKQLKFKSTSKPDVSTVVASTSKPEVSTVVASTSEGKVIHKTDHVIVKEKLRKPEVSVHDLRAEAVRMASNIFLLKLAEKLGFSMKKDLNIGTGEPSGSSGISPPVDKPQSLDPDFKAFELATEKLFSSISEMKRLFEKGQSVPREHKYKPVEPTYKPNIKVVKVPEIARKPRILTQLNPRFIVKPVSLPEEKGDKHNKGPNKDSIKRVVRVYHVTKPTESPKQAVHVPKRVEDSKVKFEYSAKPNPYSGLNIAPETKEALARIYYRYLKIRNLA